MLAFIACNGTFIVVGLLSLLGVSQAINPHIQAAVVSLFAMATLIFVYLVFKHSARQGHWYWR